MLLSLARSGVYRPPPANDDADLALMRRIDELFMAWPFLGSRRLAEMLRAEGCRVNRKRVQRLMRLTGIAALGPKPRTSKPAPGHKVYPYLLQLFSVSRSIVFQLLPRPKWLRRPGPWLYQRLQSRRGQPGYPRAGLLQPGDRSPDIPLNLQRGELVRIKSHDQILATINSQNLHRGLYFDVEMIPYCGRERSTKLAA